MPETIIHTNGSKWHGEKPDSITALLKLLKVEVIEHGFFLKAKQHGEWVVLCPIIKNRETGMYKFWGNFEGLSHVFDIESNDPKVIAKLKKAIMNNEGWKKHLGKLKRKA